ncbi:single-stranded nucleic acid binding protein [Clostridium sp. CAG:533]|nr:single-stranded nucleic acid binding protein [Clostridium sp. CAG:533]
MKEYVYEGKDQEVVLKKVLEDLNVTENDFVYTKEEVKGKLFKAGTTKYHVYLNTDILEFIKDYLNTLLTEMGLEVKFESNIRDKQINIKMYSNNNPILIGKNGQTLTALTAVCKAAVFARIGIYPYLNLDASDYKDKQVSHLERLAKNIAREVRNTGREVVMDNMNSYERRIVHNVLTDFKGVMTISEGEEPNRHIIVKPKKD